MRENRPNSLLGFNLGVRAKESCVVTAGERLGQPKVPTAGDQGLCEERKRTGEQTKTLFASRARLAYVAVAVGLKCACACVTP